MMTASAGKTASELTTIAKTASVGRRLRVNINHIALIESKNRKLRALARDFLFFMIPCVAIVFYLMRALQETQGRAFNLRLASFVCVWRVRQMNVL